ncbi:hypothetical protein DPQ22_07120 [Candidatus Tokpelaia sp.]|nr:hypothetical protein DPQ22_07120 [Candidatus Tokpelaia sp.]
MQTAGARGACKPQGRARAVQTAPGLDARPCGGGRSKEQARMSCAKCGQAATEAVRRPLAAQI